MGIVYKTLMFWLPCLWILSFLYFPLFIYFLKIFLNFIFRRVICMSGRRDEVLKFLFFVCWGRDILCIHNFLSTKKMDTVCKFPFFFWLLLRKFLSNIKKAYTNHLFFSRLFWLYSTTIEATTFYLSKQAYKFILKQTSLQVYN